MQACFRGNEVDGSIGLNALTGQHGESVPLPPNFSLHVMQRFFKGKLCVCDCAMPPYVYVYNVQVHVHTTTVAYIFLQTRLKFDLLFEVTFKDSRLRLSGI